MKLAGQVAIIVGGARGIGEAIAHLFSKEGAKIVLVDLDKAKSQLDGVAQAINQQGGSAIALVADAADDAQVNSMGKHRGIAAQQGRRLVLAQGNNKLTAP